MSMGPEHLAGVTTHTRKGAVRHGFRYGVDYVMIDPEQKQRSPLLFSRNKFNFSAVHDIDHGGPLGCGRGPAWARAALRANGLADQGVVLRLLTQPRFLGYVFNPVSFWLAFRGRDLVAVIAEVSTPFHDRHSYLCHLPDFAPITGENRIEKPKSLHVSPYQDVAGYYQFGFDIREDQIAIRIIHKNGEEGVVATLSGPRAPMTSAALIKASLRRPLGAMRTIGLIYWQALILKLKGANYRSRPTPPKTEVS